MREETAEEGGATCPEAGISVDAAVRTDCPSGGQQLAKIDPSGDRLAATERTAAPDADSGDQAERVPQETRLEGQETGMKPTVPGIKADKEGLDQARAPGQAAAEDLLAKESRPETPEVAVGASAEAEGGQPTTLARLTVPDPDEPKELALRDRGQDSEETQRRVQKEEEQATPIPVLPKFDIVRADRNGMVVVAGTAEPGSLVAAVADDVIAETVTNEVGAFATVFRADYLSNVLDIYLTSRLPDGTVLRSDETLHLILPTAEILVPAMLADNPEPVSSDPVKLEPNPIAVVSTKDDVTVMQPLISKTAESAEELLIETISYDEAGEVRIAGQGKPNSYVRVYLDGALIKIRRVSPDGNWSANLSEVDPGVYVLRVDEINENGVVTARAETPLKKEAGDVVRELIAIVGTVGTDPTGEEHPGTTLITVQKGYTMWGISRNRYGLGRLYVQVFHANRDLIRDPHWIYPGQVFVVPDPDDFVDLGCEILSRCKLIHQPK